MPFSDTYATQFLNYAFGKISGLTSPSSVYIGLCSNDPEADNGAVTELSGKGYSRVLVAQKGASFPNTFGSASNREIKNAYQINWTKATEDWDRVKGFLLADAAAGGDIFFYGKLDLTEEEEAAGGLLVEAGMVALFDPQSFQISFPATDSDAE